MRTLEYLATMWGVFWLGTVLGSFLNVCIYRLPRKESIVKPASRCPHCGERIKIWDNIPLLSYILLGGRCRYCNARISPRYPIVELVTGFVLSALFFTYGWSLLFFHYALLSLLLIVVSFIDVEHKLILNVITVPGIVIGWSLIVFFRPISLSDSLTGLVIGAGSLWMVAVFGKLIFHKESMGAGDIKLAAMIGIFLGWKATTVSLFLAFLVAALFGTSCIFSGKAKRDSAIPFGPFISVGVFVFIFFGDDIVNAYVSLVLS